MTLPTNPTEELPRRKFIRLDHRLYADTSHVVSVTIAVQGRQPIFLPQFGRRLRRGGAASPPASTEVGAPVEPPRAPAGGHAGPPLRSPLADACHRALQEHFQRHGIDVYAWTVMPDHAHFCVEPTPDRDVMRIVSGIKQETTRVAWKFGHRGSFWQRSFYDHFLRDNEDTETVCRYIWNNPVRARLVRYWKQWPYNGSTVFDLARLR